QENDFFWRSVAANNVKDDMHIGAYQSSTEDVWRWNDQNERVAGYNNFIKSFPIPGNGNCSAMLTESPSAQWVNVDCDNQKLPFVCRR
ncbi:hypothetical protein PFISCL1PPCAC_17694, partial [Pristionchus fissidentatus]